MNRTNVLLASNASMQMHPKNKPQRFTVELAKPLVFDGEWEAALTHVTYPNNYYNVTEKSSLVVSLFIYKLKEGNQRMFITQLDINVDIQPGYYASVREILDILNLQLKQGLENHAKILRESKSEAADDATHIRIVFEIHEQRKEIWLQSVLHDNLVIIVADFKGSMDAFRSLGFSEQVLNFRYPLPVKTKRPPSLIYNTAIIFVQCDCVEEMCCGDSMTQLLMSFPRRVESNIIYEQFQKPIFRKLNKDLIRSITIWLSDDSGQEIVFPVGKTTFMLEFRKCNLI